MYVVQSIIILNNGDIALIPLYGEQQGTRLLRRGSVLEVNISLDGKFTRVKSREDICIFPDTVHPFHLKQMLDHLEYKGS